MFYNCKMLEDMHLNVSQESIILVCLCCPIFLRNILLISLPGAHLQQMSSVLNGNVD